MITIYLAFEKLYWYDTSHKGGVLKPSGEYYYFRFDDYDRSILKREGILLFEGNI